MPSHSFMGTLHHVADSAAVRLNKRNFISILNRIVLLMALVAPSLLLAQDKIKWGEVPRADLEMKIFPADTNATPLFSAISAKLLLISSSK